MSQNVDTLGSLSARAEISDLIYGYAELMDVGDFAGIGRLLEHASISVEGSQNAVTGSEAVEATYTRWSTRYPDSGTPKTKHVITNVMVKVDDTGDSATARAYFTVLQAVEGKLPLQPILAGRYRDSFQRVEGRWRFTRLHVLWDLSGELSCHINEGAQ